MKDIIKSLSKDPRYIAGIYNYCDRWCKRCSFTSRCLNYETEKRFFGDSDKQNLNDPEFWSKLKLLFQQTEEMIVELAEEKGIELNSLDMESKSDGIPDIMSEAENRDITSEAHEYSKIVNLFFEAENSLFEQKQDELNTVVRLGISGTDTQAEVIRINDAVEVIRWYQHQIFVKLMRAVMQEDVVNGEEEGDAEQSDSNGSAKVALIGIERSIGAWRKVIEYFPEKTDDILNVLLHLDQLRKKTEQEFPNAKNFIRPGFDTINHLE